MSSVTNADSVARRFADARVVLVIQDDPREAAAVVWHLCRHWIHSSVHAAAVAVAGGESNRAMVMVSTGTTPSHRQLWQSMQQTESRWMDWTPTDNATGAFPSVVETTLLNTNPLARFGIYVHQDTKYANQKGSDQKGTEDKVLPDVDAKKRWVIVLSRAVAVLAHTSFAKWRDRVDIVIGMPMASGGESTRFYEYYSRRRVPVPTVVRYRTSPSPQPNEGAAATGDLVCATSAIFANPCHSLLPYRERVGACLMHHAARKWPRELVILTLEYVGECACGICLHAALEQPWIPATPQSSDTSTASGVQWYWHHGSYLRHGIETDVSVSLPMLSLYGLP